MMMGYGFGSSFGWLGMGLGLLMHVAFTALIVMSVIWMFKVVFNGTLRTNRQIGAMDILKQRYAKGEIDSEEYQRIKKDLE